MLNILEQIRMFSVPLKKNIDILLSYRALLCLMCDKFAIDNFEVFLEFMKSFLPRMRYSKLEI